MRRLDEMISDGYSLDEIALRYQMVHLAKCDSFGLSENPPQPLITNLKTKLH